MACHGLAECAERADTGARTVYKLRFFNDPVFFESHRVHHSFDQFTGDPKKESKAQRNPDTRAEHRFGQVALMRAAMIGFTHAAQPSRLC